ncbi:MAG: hypothetical protein C4K60_20245 [Ideonella sp. MAG2]|nr:MAG: hypothetical protein C4K60_20245 [Ideonella sp. MAG2]
MFKEMFNSSVLVSLRVPWTAYVACWQVLAQLVLAIPGSERVLRRIPELVNGQADALTQLDVQLHGSKPILV